MRAMKSTRRKLEAFEERCSEDKRFRRSWRHQKHLFRSSSPEADVIKGSEDHQKMEDWRTSTVVQMMIESRLSLQKIARIKQRLFQMDLKALNAYSVESVEKGHLYEVYNHYLHYSVFVSASTRTTVVPATVFLQTWNGFEIDPS